MKNKKWIKCQNCGHYVDTENIKQLTAQSIFDDLLKCGLKADVFAFSKFDQLKNRYGVK